MRNQPVRLSPLAVIVLALLDEAPMYPYRMQQLIRERGQDQVVNIRHRASLYQTIARLEREGLLATAGTSRAENRPERTTYRLTSKGRTALHRWLREMLASPAAEFSEFPVALSCLYLLEPEDVQRELTRRGEILATREQELRRVLDEHTGVVPRLFLLETEYQQIMAGAERAWVLQARDDLAAGQLTWSGEEIRRNADASNEQQVVP